MIKKVIKKPLIVSAVQLTADNESFVSAWSNKQVWKDGEVYKVLCLEALADTPIGSWVVMGVKGEVWPVREDIFNESYDILED